MTKEIIYTNIRSVSHNLPIFLSSFVPLNSEIIALSETWCKDESVIPSIDGFSYISCPSHRGKAGGIIIYFRNHLKVSNIPIAKYVNNFNEAEFIALDVRSHDLILILIYRHPTSNFNGFFDCLNTILTSADFNKPNKICCMLGDINIDILKRDKVSNTYINLLKSLHFEPLIMEPTRITLSSQTCIDHVFVKYNNNLKAKILQTQITDHAIIRVNYCSGKTDNIVKYRLHNTKNLTKFYDCISHVKWDAMFNASDSLDNIIDKFCSILLMNYNNAFPLKQKKNKKNVSVPWITKKITFMIQRKKCLLRRFKKSKSAKNNVVLSNHTKQMKSLIKQTKQNYYTSLFLRSNHTDKWKIINTLRSKSALPGEVTDSVTGCQILEYLSSVFSNPNSRLGLSPASMIPSTSHTIFIRPTNQEEILRYLRSLPNKATKQENDLPLFIWKNAAPYISDLIASFVNTMFESCEFPSLFKKTEITPIFKKGDRNDPSNYRPIAILHNLSKIFEKALLDRMFSFIDTFNILADCQFGFRPKFSTKDAVLCLLLKIEENYLNKKKTCVIFIDLTKAFDFVSHDNLVFTLSEYGLRGKFSVLLNNYLSNRFFRVKFNGSFTKYKPISRGVPQGSLLGPLLYSLYVNDMSLYLDCNIVQYADDTTLIIPYASENELVNSINLIENRLKCYLNSKSLLINNTKTSIMLFGDTHIKVVNFLSRGISVTNECTFLGIKLDSKCTFAAHIYHICNNIKRLFHSFYFFRDIFDKHTKQLFFNAYVIPHILYAVPFLINCNQDLMKKLNVAYKSAIKILFKYPRQFPSITLHNTTGIENLHSLIKLHTAVYAYKIYTKQVPNIIHTHFHSTIRHNFILHTHTNANSIYNNLCMLWNNLPLNIRSLSSLHAFKMSMRSNF